VIDASLFTVESLLHVFLDDTHGNVDAWRKYASIEPMRVRYSACHDSSTKCDGWVVRFGKSYLRHSCGPGGSLIWDLYPDDFQSPALAFRRLLDAPVPPSICRPWPPDPDAKPAPADEGGESHGL
jgi:hypothetical protein